MKPNHVLAALAVLAAGLLPLAARPPCPVLLVHDVGAADTAWTQGGAGGGGFAGFLQTTYGWSAPQIVSVCANQATTTQAFGTNGTPDDPGTYVDDDVRYWGPTTLPAADVYVLNLHTDRAGTAHSNLNLAGQSESNAAALWKQGYVVQMALRRIVAATGAKEVTIVGHGMGGVAAREYLQRISIGSTRQWWFVGTPGGTAAHHVGKLVTVGTPHGGAPSSGWQALLGTGHASLASEAVRDMLPSNNASLASRTEGQFLFGGFEAGVATSWHNKDVNANGLVNDKIYDDRPSKPLNADTTALAENALNPLPADIELFCLAGDTGAGSDGVVATTSAILGSASCRIESRIVTARHAGGALPPSGMTPLLEDFASLLGAMDEPDDAAHAFTVVAPVSFDGFISTQGGGVTHDADFYQFEVPGATQATVSITGLTTGSGSFRLRGPDGTVVLEGVPAPDFGPVKTWLQPGTHRIEIEAAVPTGNMPQRYHVSVGMTPYLAPGLELADGAATVDEGATIPAGARSLTLSGDIGGDLPLLESLEVIRNGQVVATHSGASAFALDIPLTANDYGLQTMLLVVRSTDGTTQQTYLTFRVGGEGSYLTLDAAPASLTTGRYRDMVVTARTDEALSGVSFTVETVPGAGVAKLQGIYPVSGHRPGSLELFFDERALAAGDPVRVATTCTGDEQFEGGRRPLAVLRFDVTGAAGDFCRVRFSDVRGVTRRDFVALEATQLVLPMAAGFHGLDASIEVGEMPEGQVWLEGVPSQPMANHAVWVDLMAATDGAAPTGLTCRIEYPAGAVRVLAVEPYEPDTSVVWQPDGLRSGSLWIAATRNPARTMPAGPLRVARILFDWRGLPAGFVGGFAVRGCDLFDGAGWEIRRWYAPDTEVPWLVVAPAAPQLVLQAPTPLPATFGQAFSTPLKVGWMPRMPTLLAGEVRFDERILSLTGIAAVGPYSGGSVWIGPATASGRRRFVATGLHAALRQGVLAEVLRFDWTLKGDSAGGEWMSVTIDGLGLGPVGECHARPTFSTVVAQLAPPGAPGTSPPQDVADGPIDIALTSGGGTGVFRYQVDAMEDDGWSQMPGTLFRSSGNLPEGLHAFHFQERQANGSWGPSITTAAMVDRTPPSVSAGDDTISGNEVNLQGHATDSLSGVERVEWSQTAGPATASLRSPDSLACWCQLPVDGAYEFRLRAWDRAGNFADDFVNVGCDLTPPPAPLVSGPANSADGLVTWTWTSGGGGGGGFRIRLTSSGTDSGWLPVSGTAYFRTVPLGLGAHTLAVQERDAVGNWSVAGTHTIAVGQPPALELDGILAVTADGAAVAEGAVLPPGARNITVSGQVVAAPGLFGHTEVWMNGVKIGNFTGLAFASTARLGGFFEGPVVVSVKVHDIHGEAIEFTRSFTVAESLARLSFGSEALSAKPGGFLFVPVVLDAPETRVVGFSAKLDLRDCPGVLRPLGFYPVGDGPDNLIPWHNEGLFAGSGLVPVLSMNATRMEPATGRRVSMVAAFQVVGEPGATCNIGLTDASGCGPVEPFARIAVDPVGATVRISDAPVGGLRFQSLPERFVPYQWHYLTIVVDTRGEALGGFDFDLTLPRDRFRVMETFTVDPSVTYALHQVPGSDLIRVAGSRVPRLDGAKDLVPLLSLKIEVLGDAPVGNAGIGLAMRELVLGAGEQIARAEAGASVPVIPLAPQEQLAVTHADSGGREARNGDVFETVMKLNVGEETPDALRGLLTYDRDEVVLENMSLDGSLAGAELMVDPDSFPWGYVDFLVTQYPATFTSPDGQAPSLRLRWRAMKTATTNSAITLLSDGVAHDPIMGPNFGPGPAAFDYGIFPSDLLPDDWELAKLGDLADNAESDRDGDGRSTFLEWAMALNPASGNDPMSTHLAKEAGGLVMRYRRNKDAAAVEFIPQVGTDLTVWHWNGDGSGTTYTDDSVAPVDNGDGSETITVKVLNPGAGSPAVFGRVRVRQP
jgi:hypothetical protein